MIIIEIVHASTRNHVFSLHLHDLICLERNLFSSNKVLFCLCCISEVNACNFNINANEITARQEDCVVWKCGVGINSHNYSVNNYLT